MVGANLDGPLAVHGGGIKAGVKGRGDDSFVCSQHAATTVSCKKQKSNEQQSSKDVWVDQTGLSYTHLDYL